jgi:propanol-preferring alcohol dehydrogenase
MLVCVGMPEGDMVPTAKAFPAMMVAMEHNIKGSAVGNQREAIEILDMAARGVVKTQL